MSANSRFISEAIFGQQEGQAIVRRLQVADCSPDVLYEQIVNAVDAGDPSLARLRGLCRAVQKALERQIEATIR